MYFSKHLLPSGVLIENSFFCVVKQSLKQLACSCFNGNKNLSFINIIIQLYITVVMLHYCNNITVLSYLGILFIYLFVGLGMVL